MCYDMQEKAEGRGPKRVAEDDDQAIISSRDQAIAVQIEEYNVRSNLTIMLLCTRFYLF